MNVMQFFEMDHMKRDVADMPIGATVKVHFKIIEGEKERVQIFQGVVIARKRAGIRSTLTVRKVTAGVGIERVFPIHSPKVEKVELVREGRIRRSKLYYLRSLKGKKARIQEKEHMFETGETPSGGGSSGTPES